jgi:hypothetical protein
MTSTWRSGTSGSHVQSHCFGEKDSVRGSNTRKEKENVFEGGEMWKNTMDSVIFESPIVSSREREEG